MDKSNKIIDVDYKNINTENTLSPLYYSTSQVAQILGVTDSTIRFWSNKLEEKKIIIKRNGNHRQFTKENINVLKRFQKLVNEKGFNIKQAVEYCIETDDKKLEKQIEEHQPLAMEALCSAIVTELGSCLEDFKVSIKDDIEKSLKEEISNVIQKQKEMQENNIKEILDIKKKQESILLELQETKKDVDMSLKLRENMEQTRIENNKKNSHGFISWILRKKER